MNADERLKRLIGELHFALAIAEARAEKAEARVKELEEQNKQDPPQ